MGAHNNPNGNCQPLDADRKGEARMFTMHHRTLIRTLQRVCVCVQNVATSRETSSFIYDTRVA